MIQEVLYRLNVEDFEKYVSAGGDVVHASSLPLCPLKWFYRLKYPDLAKAQQYAGYMILGKLVHFGLQKLLMELQEAGLLDFKILGVEVELEKTINIERNGLPVIVHVKGRADIIAEKNGEKLVVEIKTAKGDYNIPAPHHLEQLRIYMNMAGAGKGMLIYVTPDRIAEYPVDKPLSDFELQKLVQEFYSRKGPRYDWECQYHCPYAVLCPYKKTNRR